MVQVLYKGRKRLVHIGKNGGKYVIVQGTKRYLKPKTKTAKKKPAKKKTTKTKMKGGINGTGHLGTNTYNNPRPNSPENRSNNTARTDHTASTDLSRQPEEEINNYESRLASLAAKRQAENAAAAVAEREAKIKANKLNYLSTIGQKVKYKTFNGKMVNGTIQSINGTIIVVKLNRGGILRYINTNDPERLAKIFI